MEGNDMGWVRKRDEMDGGWKARGWETRKRGEQSELTVDSHVALVVDNDERVLSGQFALIGAPSFGGHIPEYEQSSVPGLRV